MMKFNPHILEKKNKKELLTIIKNLENIILKQNYYKSKKKIINRRNSI